VTPPSVTGEVVATVGLKEQQVVEYVSKCRPWYPDVSSQIQIQILYYFELHAHQYYKSKQYK
jgi:hypothetical protein